MPKTKESKVYMSFTADQYESWKEAMRAKGQVWIPNLTEFTDYLNETKE